MLDPGLTDKVVLVTGGNNPLGIGAATARAFAAQDAAIFIHYYRQPAASDDPQHDAGANVTPGISFFLRMQAKSADEVAEAIRRQGARTDAWECSLAEPEAIPQLFDRVEKLLGPVDVLVNNAADYLADTFLPADVLKDSGRALWEQGPLVSTITSESHDRQFAVNTRAPALMMAEFARRHVQAQRRWGRIINVSADCSWGCPGEIAYRASKYALESYSRSAAAELGPLGITVNVVSPGPVQTGYITPEAERELVADIPLRRLGRPEDIAEAIVFLASEQASWVTGQLLCVHGGHRMALGR